MPNTNGNRQPLRTYRAEDDVYLPAQEAAAKRGDNLSEVIRRALIEYAKPKPTARHNPGRRRTDKGTR